MGEKVFCKQTADWWPKEFLDRKIPAQNWIPHTQTHLFYIASMSGKIGLQVDLIPARCVQFLLCIYRAIFFDVFNPTGDLKNTNPITSPICVLIYNLIMCSFFLQSTNGTETPNQIWPDFLETQTSLLCSEYISFQKGINCTTKKWYYNLNNYIDDLIQMSLPPKVRK